MEDYIQLREERMEMMARVRYLIFQINYSMNFNSRAFFVIKYAISNMYDYVYEKRKVENGNEPENIKNEELIPVEKEKNANKKNEKKVDKKAEQKLKEEMELLKKKDEEMKLEEKKNEGIIKKEVDKR